jgi:hypothetical protein
MPFGGEKQHFGLIFAEEKWPFVEIFDGWPSFYSLFWYFPNKICTFADEFGKSIEDYEEIIVSNRCDDVGNGPVVCPKIVDTPGLHRLCDGEQYHAEEVAVAEAECYRGTEGCQGRPAADT